MAGVNPSLTNEIALHLVRLNRIGITLVLEHDMALNPVQTAAFRERLVGSALLLILRWRPQGMRAAFQPPGFSAARGSR